MVIWFPQGGHQGQRPRRNWGQRSGRKKDTTDDPFWNSSNEGIQWALQCAGSPFWRHGKRSPGRLQACLAPTIGWGGQGEVLFSAQYFATRIGERGSIVIILALHMCYLYIIFFSQPNKTGMTLPYGDIISTPHRISNPSNPMWMEWWMMWWMLTMMLSFQGISFKILTSLNSF